MSLYVDELRLKLRCYFDNDICDSICIVFAKFDNSRDGQGCLIISFLIHTILQYYNKKSIVKYGLCNMVKSNPENEETQFYHVWLEVDQKVIDLAIYGNTRYNDLYKNTEQYDCVVMENYDSTKVLYSERSDNNFFHAGIYGVQNGMNKYFNGMPNLVKDKTIDQLCQALNKNSSKDKFEIKKFLKKIYPKM